MFVIDCTLIFGFIATDWLVEAGEKKMTCRLKYLLCDSLTTATGNCCRSETGYAMLLSLFEYQPLNGHYSFSSTKESMTKLSPLPCFFRYCLLQWPECLCVCDIFPSTLALVLSFDCRGWLHLIPVCGSCSPVPRGKVDALGTVLHSSSHCWEMIACNIPREGGGGGGGGSPCVRNVSVLRVH